MTKANLKRYPDAMQASFVMKDLRKLKDMTALVHTNSRNFFLTFPELSSPARWRTTSFAPYGGDDRNGELAGLWRGRRSRQLRRSSTATPGAPGLSWRIRAFSSTRIRRGLSI